MKGQGNSKLPEKKIYFWKAKTSSRCGLLAKKTKEVADDFSQIYCVSLSLPLFPHGRICYHSTTYVIRWLHRSVPKQLVRLHRVGIAPPIPGAISVCSMQALKKVVSSCDTRTKNGMKTFGDAPAWIFFHYFCLSRASARCKISQDVLYRSFVVLQCLHPTVLIIEVETCMTSKKS